MKRPHVEPTRDHLLRAFACLHSDSWPGTLDAALSDPYCSRLLHGKAVSLARADLAPPPQVPALFQAPVVTRPPAPLPAAPQARPFDARRAAANDFDDE